MSGRYSNGNHLIRTAEQNSNLKIIRNQRNLWETSKFANIHIIDVPKEEEREENSVFEEIMPENNSNLKKKTDMQL